VIVKKGTRHEWRERDEDGEVYFVRAVHFGGRWEFFRRANTGRQFKDEEEWYPIDPVPLFCLRSLLEVLEAKYTRKRLGWETVERVAQLIEDHPELHFRRPLLDLLSEYGERHEEEAKAIRRYRDFVIEHVDCFQREQLKGHVTASAWIVDPPGRRVLLTHHRKLDRWLQPGGHADGVTDVLEVALKEAREETGIPSFEVVGEGLFDVDIHGIPEHGGVPPHDHYDARFLFRAGSTECVVSDESHDLAWVSLDDLESYTEEESMLRMRDKCIALIG